jgi:hypothetical protein
MIRKLDPYIIAGVALGVILMMTFGVVYGYSCNVTYSAQWNETWHFSNLSELTSYCSNGGN